MKILILACSLLTFSAIVNAQTLTISPSNTVNVEYELEDFDATKISLFNTSGETIVLNWSLLDNNLPIGWDYSLCDFGSCHPGVPAERTMDPMGDGVEGYLIMNIFYLDDASEGSISFLLMNNHNNDVDTITFNFSPKATTGVANAKNNKEMKMFPNPASNALQIKNPFSSPGILSIINAGGTVVYNETLNPGIQSTDISSLANGFYIVRLRHQDSVIVKKLTIVK
ncbi:MAG: T9SS type A sorting domain-containing protein [Bacteroidetes bacterium]|nr:T9SS type A sorting domain-containing protein [Bacteroidota bacterium]